MFDMWHRPPSQQRTETPKHGASSMQTQKLRSTEEKYRWYKLPNANPGLGSFLWIIFLAQEVEKPI
jgi:hypothetical protein